MKNNTFKRVLAGSLALLTVAAPMTANVGGILQEVAIVASAATTVKVQWTEAVGQYITSISDGTTTLSGDSVKNSESYKFTENVVLTIKSSIPLTLGADFTEAAKGTDLTAKEGETYTNAKKYLVTVSGGVYTYQVLNNSLGTITGVAKDASALSVTLDKDNTTLKLTDGTAVVTKAMTDAVTINGGNPTTLNNSPTEITGLFAEGNAEFVADSSFEVFTNVTVGTGEEAVVTTTKTAATYVANYNADGGKFVATVKVPAQVLNEEGNDTSDVKFYVSAVTPNYTYTNKGTQLLATSDDGATKDAVVASVTAKSQAKVKTNKEEKEQLGSDYKYDTAADLATGSAVANESRVELTFKNDETGKLTSQSADGKKYTLKITRDGKELDPQAEVETAATYNGELDSAAKTYEDVKDGEDAYAPGTLSFNATGKYVVEYTVFTTTTKDGATTVASQTLKYEFEIQTKALLTAENVRLTASGNNLKGANGNKVVKAAVVNGVVEFEVTEDWKDDVITIDPKIFADAEYAADTTRTASDFSAGAATADGTPKSVTGTTKSDTLNKENTLTIVYNNSDYSASDQSIVVKWKLVEASKEVTVEPNEDYLETHEGATFQDDPYLTTTIDNLDTLEEDIFGAITIVNGDASKVTFEYIKGYDSTIDQDELDWREEGLPTEKGQYSVYVLYNGEAINSFNLYIAEHALYAAPTDAQLSITYGDKAFTSDDLAFVDADGKAVKDADVAKAGISFKKATKLEAKDVKKITAENKVTVNNVTYDVYTINGDKYITSNVAADYTVTGYIDAGAYVVTINNTAGDTTIGKEGYELMSKSFGMYVAQKEITKNMVLIDPTAYNDGKSVTVGEFTVKDTAVKDADGAAVEVTVTVAGGTTSASAIGAYDIDLKVDEEQSPNYTGKVTAQWHIVAAGQDMAALKFVDETTTIYNNGQIHFEVTRPADNQFANGVERYGVIIEKDGLLDAPKLNTADYGKTAATQKDNYPRVAAAGTTGFAADDEFEAATKALVVGNGFKEGQQSEKLRKENPTKYGANIAVKDVETGAWFRPYVVDGKGNIYYGEVIYVNLVQEATEQLNLKMSEVLTQTGNTKNVTTKDEAKEGQSATVLADKSWREDVTSGYNRAKAAYYVYGSYTLDENSNVKTDAVQGFGVVVDKKGAFTPNGTLVADETVNVADGLKLDNGYIEGKSGSNKMDVDEYGALITPYNSVTGVWVRAYVDLGNNLVVYTEPKYIKTVSEIYGADTAEIDEDGLDFESGKVTVEFNPALNVTNPNASLKYAGVVVDKSGSFLVKDDYTRGLDDDTAYDTKLILGNGFIQGKKNAAALTGGTTYKANITPDTYRADENAAVTNIPVVVRPYAVYEINGKEVVVYGEVKVASVTDRA